MTFLAFALAGFVLQSQAGSRELTPDQLLREAKLALLDREWEASRAYCERLLVRFPRSPLSVQARLYLARAHEGAGEQRQALSAYQSFLRVHAEDDELTQDARTAAIGLARKLIEGGEEDYWPFLREGLFDPSRSVRAYAALQVSHLADPRRAREAVPVLSELVQSEANPDLRDRARIALLRLDPRALIRAEESLRAESERRERRGSMRGRWLKLRLQRGGDEEVRMVFPLALGELVYRALSEELKRELKREKGIDLDNFWAELGKLGTGKILSIESEGQRFELWIE
jgi:hypothetical protein